MDGATSPILGPDFVARTALAGSAQDDAARASAAAAQVAAEFAAEVPEFPVVTRGDLVDASRVVYASATCELDSNVLTGGGTDNTAALQAILDTGGNANDPLELVLDGAALISDPLVVKSHTRIRCSSAACGVFLAANSHCHILTNQLSGTTIANTNIEILGGTWNGNCANQGKWENNASLVGTPHPGPYDRIVGWNYGFWFSGFNKVLLKDVTIRDAKTFSITLCNGSDFRVENCTAFWSDNDGVTVTNNNRDGIHMLGDLSDGHIDGFWSNGDDDVLAFNSDEDVNINEPRRGTGAAIQRIYAENVVFNAAANGVRLYGENGVGVIDNITIKNTSGTLKQGVMSCSPPTVYGGSYTGTYASSALLRLGRIVLDGWNHTATGTASNKIIVTNAERLTLRNIPSTVLVESSARKHDLSYESIGSLLMERGYWSIPCSAGAATLVGTGSGAVNINGFRLATGATANSSALWRPNSSYWMNWGRNADEGVAWNRPISVSVSTQVGNGTGGKYRIQLGRTSSATTIEDLSAAGIGIILQSGNIYLEAHNGTTRVVSDALATYTTGAYKQIALRMRAYRGVLTLWVNGVQVGSINGAPSVAASNTLHGLFLSVENLDEAASYIFDMKPDCVKVLVEP